MRRILTSEWVAIHKHGIVWAYYRPGEQGNRNAHGYIKKVKPSNTYDVYLSSDPCCFYPFKFGSLKEAGMFLLAKASA